MTNKHREAIERLYTDIFSATEKKKVKRPDKSTVLEDIVVFTDVPCKLSFSKTSTAQQSDTGAAITQNVVLFTAPEVEVKPGTEITVTRAGKEFHYKASGQPFVFTSHQEIPLELLKEWA